MTTIGMVTRRSLEETARWASRFGAVRLAVLVAIALLAAISPSAGQIIAKSLSDAFL